MCKHDFSRDRRAKKLAKFIKKSLKNHICSFDPTPYIYIYNFKIKLGLQGSTLTPYLIALVMDDVTIDIQGGIL
jgi:hypothetical protein